jgi:hypothetical protein
MKKKIIFLIPLILLIIVTNGCNGYKPIFSSSNIKFKISDYKIEGNQKIGKIIYSKLNYLSKRNEKDAQNIFIKIKVEKEKKPISKNSAGKVLEYRVHLNTQVLVRKSSNDNVLLNYNFNDSSPFRVQDQYSETLKLENQALENLINKNYQNLLIALTESISKK